MIQTRLMARLNRAVARPTADTPETRRAFWSILGVLLGLGVLAAALYLAPETAVKGLAILGPGLLVAALMWHRPELGLLGLIFLTSSFVPVNVVDLRLPIGGGLDLRDMVLIGLVGLAALRELARGNPSVPWWPVGGLLLLFLLMAVFSAFSALVLQHVEANWVLSDLRILILYTTFYATIWSINRPEQLKTLVIGLFIIADLNAAISYIQQFVGAANPILQAMSTSRDWRVYGEVGAIRVIPAGQVLMHVMWFVALGLLLIGRPSRRLKAFCLLQLVYIGGGHLLSYVRAEWSSLAVGLGLVLILLIPRYKKHLATTAVIASCAAVLLAAVIATGVLPESATPQFMTGISARMSSLLTPFETVETGSMLWRNFEIEKALQALARQPLTGVGLGNRYRALTTFLGEASGWWTRGSIAAGEVSRFTRYVHNSYMSIAVKMGIPALIVYLWFYLAVLLKGFWLYRGMTDSRARAVILGVCAGLASLLVWSYFHAHLIKAESTPVIGLMVGLLGSMAYLQKQGLLAKFQMEEREGEPQP